MSQETEPKEETKTISVTLRTDLMTNTVVKEANILIVALPLNTPKFVALGFLWSVISEMTTFFAACEEAAKHKNSGIIRGTMESVFGKKH